MLHWSSEAQLPPAAEAVRAPLVAIWATPICHPFVSQPVEGERRTALQSAPRPQRSPKATPQEFCTSAERFADWQCLAKHGRGGECPLNT